jgi:hypothetical protein
MRAHQRTQVDVDIPGRSGSAAWGSQGGHTSPKPSRLCHIQNSPGRRRNNFAQCSCFGSRKSKSQPPVSAIIDTIVTSIPLSCVQLHPVFLEARSITSAYQRFLYQWTQDSQEHYRSDLLPSVQRIIYPAKRSRQS